MKAKMVTRTIKVTVATVKMLNLETEQIYETEISILGVYKTPEKLASVVKTYCEDDTRHMVMVLTSRVEEKLFGMSELRFLENAVELPPRAGK